MAKALRAGQPEEFMQILEALFANTTYQIQGDSEKNFQYAMYIIIELVVYQISGYTSDLLPVN